MPWPVFSFEELLDLLIAEHATLIAENGLLRSKCGTLPGTQASGIMGPFSLQQPLVPSSGIVGELRLKRLPSKICATANPVDLSAIPPTIKNKRHLKSDNETGSSFSPISLDEDEESKGTEVFASGGAKASGHKSAFGAKGVSSPRAHTKSFDVPTDLSFTIKKRLSISFPPQPRMPRLTDFDPRNIKPQNLVINPERSQFLEHWDILTMICLGWVAIVTPVQLSLIEPEFDVLCILNSLVDCLFFVDLVLQFFLMYPRKGTYGYILEHRWGRIVKRYLRTWFVVDLISIVPIDLIGIITKAASMQRMKVVKFVRLMRLLKLARMLKASRLFRRIEVRMSISNASFALIKFICLLCLLTHWLANLWALTLVFVEESDGVPRWIDGFLMKEDNVEFKTKDSPWKIYLHCLYFTSYTITSVGYGDIGPQNIVETVVCTFILIISGMSWVVVLGEVCGIISNMNPDEQMFRDSMDELNHMMEDRAVPREMRQRVRSFFLSKKTAQRRERHRKIIGAMSPGLQGYVVMELNRTWISKVRLLSNVLRNAERSDFGYFFHAFIVDVSLSLTTAIHAQSEVFGVMNSMYILVQGLVSSDTGARATSTFTSERVHSAGAVWGQDFLLSDTRLLEPAESLALTYCETMVLNRSSFLTLVERHNGDCPGLKDKIRRFCCWLALQRALLKEARRRIKVASERRRHKEEASDAAEEFFPTPATPTSRADRLVREPDLYQTPTDEAVGGPQPFEPNVGWSLPH